MAPSKPTVIWGGPHPSVLPEESLAFDCVDMIALGEGELTMRELLERGLDPEGVHGLWYKRDSSEPGEYAIERIGKTPDACL